MSGETKAHEFTLVLSEVPGLTDERMDEIQGALLRAGCDDATLSGHGDVLSLDFHREADSLLNAVATAAAAVGRAGLGVARIEAGRVYQEQEFRAALLARFRQIVKSLEGTMVRSEPVKPRARKRRSG